MASEQTTVIALVWSDKVLSSFTYTETPTFTNAGDIQFFDPALFTMPEIEKASIKGITLSGRRYQMIKWVYKNFNITLSSDDIEEAVDAGDETIIGNLGREGVDFLRQFWVAKFKYISYLDQDGEMSDFIRVRTTEETMPLTFLDDLEIYPEINFKLESYLPITRGAVDGRYSF